MRTLFFLFLIPLLPLTCFKNRIHYSYDEFEKKQKMMMQQMYSARKDFNKNQRVRIRFYKEINKSGSYSISAKMNFHSYPSEGKIQAKFFIKIKNDIFETNFYDSYSVRINNTQTKNEHTITYHDDESEEDKTEETHISSETYTNTTTTNTFINNIAFFNIEPNIIDRILIDEYLSFRFYMGKEGYTIDLSKNQIKAMKKFIQSTL